MTEAARKPTPVFVVIGLVALVVFHVAVNVWWLHRDNAPQVGDPASHMESAKIYYRVLTNPNEPNIVKRIADIRHVPLRFYPPLTHILGAVCATVFGPITFGFAILNTFVFAALILTAYVLARTWMERWSAFFAAFAVSMTPFLFGISRLFLLDLLSALFVVLFYVVLLRSDRLQHFRWVIVLAAINVLGFWTRWTTPLYYAVPFAFVAVLALRDRKSISNLCLFLGLSTVGIGAWFLRTQSGIRETYDESFAGVQKSISLLDPLTWISYPLIVNNTGTFLVLGLLAMGGAVIALRARPFRLPLTLTALWPLSSIALLTLLAVIRNPAPRYIVPALVPLAILAVHALWAISNRTSRRVAMTGLCAVLVLQYVAITFGPFGADAAIEIPVSARIQWHTRDHNQGIVIVAAKVDGSGAKFGPPFRGVNWINEVLTAIVEADRTTYSVRNQDAKILLIGARRESISSVQRDYWPLTNPLSDSNHVRRVVGYFVENDGEFERVPQQRPPALNQVVPRIEGVTQDAVDQVEFVVRAAAERADTLPAIFDGFERLAAFEAGIFGHWEPRHFEVLWRRPRKVISFETCDTLTVESSVGGRADIPWYRYPWWTARDNPEGLAYWEASTPAIMEADFGAPYDVNGIEIAPYESAPASIRVEYWDGSEERWRALPGDAIAIADPVFEAGQRVVYHHPYPEPWAENIATQKLRFHFDGEADAIRITNVFVYHE